MKKLPALFFVLVFSAGFTTNAMDALGFTAGVEFSVENISEQNEGERQPVLRPFVIYEDSFLNGTLDIYAEFGYNAGFFTIEDNNQEDVSPHWLDINFIFGYNLFLSPVSTLTVLLEKDFDKLMLSPRFSGSNNVNGSVIPGISFNHEQSLGDFYTRIDLPIHYLHHDSGAGTEVHLDFTFGWLGAFGFGIEFTQKNILNPEANGRFHAGFDLIVSYGYGPFFAEVILETPRMINEDGINIIPLVEYSFDAFTFYLEFAINGIGIRDRSPEISPTMGLRFSF